MSHPRHQSTVPASVRLDPAESGMCPAQLTVVHGGLHQPLPPPVPLESDEVLIGRDVGEHGVNLDDVKVSRLHARVCWDPHSGGHRLGDAGSSNGTFVNGKRVRTVVLQPGDVARVGDSLILYELEDVMEETRRARRYAPLMGFAVLGAGYLGWRATGQSAPATASSSASAPPAEQISGSARAEPAASLAGPPAPSSSVVPATAASASPPAAGGQSPRLGAPSAHPPPTTTARTRRPRTPVNRMRADQEAATSAPSAASSRSPSALLRSRTGAPSRGADPLDRRR